MVRCSCRHRAAAASIGGFLKQEPHFSVAMCTFNGEKYLADQLESVASQLLLPVELVLCDDASTDGTLAIAAEFAGRAPFAVRIVRNSENLGYSRNFAQAIQLCSGELIALADQDDVWYPQKLARLGAYFKDAKVGGVFSNGDLIDVASRRLGDLWSSFRFGAADQRRLGSGHAVDVLMRRNVVTGMAFAFRSSCRDLLMGMPASWPHDAWLALMLAAEDRLVPCPERLVAYRVHAQQQIGVPIALSGKLRYLLSRGLAGYMQLSRDRNVKGYEEIAVLFEDLLASPGGRDGRGESVSLRQSARAKADHARLSIERLSRGRLERWPSVLRHYEDYRRYSPTGLQAMVRDLFL